MPVDIRLVGLVATLEQHGLIVAGKAGSGHTRRIVRITPAAVFTSLLDDLRWSIRLLRVRPTIALAVVITLGLGIGANTAVFSAIAGQLLRPLPYSDSERLVAIYNSYPKRGVDVSANTVPDYLDRREHAHALADSALYYDYSFDLAEGGTPLRVAGVGTTPSLFSTLRVEAALGRTFTEDEAVLGKERVVLLSDRLWRAQFAADPDIVGRDIRISGRAYRVVGVMPASFAFPRREVALWVPFAWTERQRSDAMRGFEFAQSIGRLRKGASVVQLNAQLDAIVTANLQRFAGGSTAPQLRQHVEQGGFTGRARPLHAHLVGDIGSTLWLLQAAVLLLLLIACANVANLLLIRFTGRRGELAMRMALGASRTRIARQLLIESGLLALAGGVLGVLLAGVGMALLRQLKLDGAELGFWIGLDWRVLGFACASALLSLLLFGLAPLLALGPGGGMVSIKAGVRGSGGGHGARRQRGLLVMLQVGLAVTLLAGTGLLGRSVLQLQQVSPGFDAGEVITVSFNLSRDRYRESSQTQQFNQQVVEAVAALPGVQSVGAVAQLPFSADFGSAPYFVESEQATASGEGVEATIQVADRGYFDTLRIPLLRGRSFSASDHVDATPVVVIDQALAQRSFPDRDPLGQRIGTAGVDGAIHWRTVVGVVASIKTRQLSEQVNTSPTFYMPIAQQPARIFRLVIRSSRPLDALAAELRAVTARLDPEQPLWEVMRLQHRIDRSLDARRAPVALLMLFAAVALALCAVGIYGVLAHSVAQRSAEIGVRMALGASQKAVVRWVLAEGGRWLAGGLLLGGGLVLLLGVQLRAQLFEVSPLDPLTLLGVLLLVATVALLACWLPARGAARISPMQALRDE
jgi:predicted permease